jgi:hypothetical protein
VIREKLPQKGSKELKFEENPLKISIRRNAKLVKGI